MVGGRQDHGAAVISGEIKAEYARKTGRAYTKTPTGAPRAMAMMSTSSAGGLVNSAALGVCAEVIPGNIRPPSMLDCYCVIKRVAP